MKWLFSSFNLKSPQFYEPKVDCMACQIKPPLTRAQTYNPKTKCCDFTPFWSGFGVGAWLATENTLSNLVDQASFEITLFGVIHNVKLRREKGAQCKLFNQDNGQCQIWEQRPPTCHNFYCASQYKNGLNVYSDLEAELLTVEAKLLNQWFFENLGTESLWRHWGQYMESSATLEVLPKALRLESLETAERHYLSMYEWLHKKSDDQLRSYLYPLQKPLAQLKALC